MMHFEGWVLIAVMPAAALAAAVFDMTSYQIPNWLTGGLALAFPLVALAAGMPLASIGWGLALGLGVLAITFALFALGWFGGGDAKLLAALACWMGFEQILPFTVLASLLGGALALLLLAFRAMPTVPPLAWAPWVAGLQDKSKGVPYGIALSAAALAIYRDTALYHALMAMA